MVRILLSTRLGERRWTQKQLSQKTGIRASTISKMYHEECDSVNLEHIERICNALNCELTNILKLERDTNIK
jgi:putative transcriptional regulator